jgi:hypothetical protein
MVPVLLAEKPDKLCPEEKKFNLAMSVTTGFVNANTTSKSTNVVRPNVKAKPRTPPTAKK